jgi:hypothetical protein
MSKRLHVKYPLFLSDFNSTWIFSPDCRKKELHISNFIKIHPVGFHADGGGGTVGHDEGKRRFSKLCERAWECLLVAPSVSVILVLLSLVSSTCSPAVCCMFNDMYVEKTVYVPSSCCALTHHKYFTCLVLFGCLSGMPGDGNWICNYRSRRSRVLIQRSGPIWNANPMCRR